MFCCGLNILRGTYIKFVKGVESDVVVQNVNVDYICNVEDTFDDSNIIRDQNINGGDIESNENINEDDNTKNNVAEIFCENLNEIIVVYVE